MRNSRRLNLQLLLVILCFSVCSTASDFAIGQVRFNDDIRPILSDKCFFCHGPDSAKREADLRLDVRDEAIASGAVVPNRVDQSEILKRILSEDPDLQMPPPSSKLGRLSDSEISKLKDWIQEGAEYEKHWSFLPLPYDALADAAKSDPIDSFVEAKLRDRGWSMQPRADVRTLARRISFDLTGLPPTEQQLVELEQNDAPDQWSRYVDSLLATPQYAERMAVDWLDISRYADSYGFQVDRERTVWQWRDWVIRSFAENKPFDQFIVEQLAGDLLPNPTPDQILATAFNRLHQQESEGGSVEEEYRVEYVCDRVQTYATAFLGLTFECARCHDHKFDPISQKEYYQLFSMFQNIDEAGLYSYFTDSPPTPTLGLLSTDQRGGLVDAADKVRNLEKELSEAFAKEIEGAPQLDTFRLWVSERQKALSELPKPGSDRDAIGVGDLQSLRQAAGVRPPILSLTMDEVKDQKLASSIPDSPEAIVEGENRSVPGRFGNAIEFTGDDPVKTKVGNFQRHDPFSVSLWISVPDHRDRNVVFHRSRAWTDAASRGYELLIEEGKLKWSLIHFWPGNAISIRTKEQLKTSVWSHVVVTYDGSSDASGLAIYIDGSLCEVEVLKNALTKNITGGGYDSIDLGERFRDRGLRGGKIDHFEVFSHALTPYEVGHLFPSGVGGTSLASHVGVDESSLAYHFVAANSSTIKGSRERLSEARKSLFSKQDSVGEIMVMQELPHPKPAFVLIRGEYNRLGDAVGAGTPEALHPFPTGAPENRLGLARWTVARDNPLTARVLVNRLWQSLFGAGLVKTSEDFGSQGARPIHASVLDALAIRFVESGWDMKGLIKTIVLSKTYQQQSVSSLEQMAEDPENEWLARGPRFRLPAEMIRDNALAAAGLLDLSVGGPPVVPYEMSESFKPAKASEGSGVYRRSLYTQWRRTGPPPAMIAFDAPRRAVCVAKRERTDSPLQALVLLNGVQYVEASRAMATELMSEFPEQPSRWAEGAFLRALSRQPTPKELQISIQMMDEQLQYFRSNPGKSNEFLKIGRAPLPDGFDADRLASVTILCQALLNHDACVVKR
ncbi:MAG: DUF1553 domain-containing protein [Pirellula sp.]|nr:DUF1553 domain-containing protein [Pirellula sp.]